ncbi:MAG: ATP-binding cassette domain-containing protein [Muribaculaceae bacterium]|nr:ATP-binding cassette domain-containing protein [Muribaculaceae bacterium]
MENNILEIRQLRKFFGDKRALNDVTFSVERGSITGLLGPNGAGKTTLLRIINGIMVADAGEALINGRAASLETT